MTQTFVVKTIGADGKPKEFSVTGAVNTQAEAESFIAGQFPEFKVTFTGITDEAAEQSGNPKRKRSAE